MINLTFSKIKNIFICIFIFCFLYLCLHLVSFVILLDGRLDHNIISIAISSYIENKTFIPFINSIESIPCKEVLKLFPNIEVDQMYHTSPVPLKDSNYLVTYITGSKESYYEFLEPSSMTRFFLNAVSDEPRCFKALGTFIEAVNDSTSK